MNQRSTVYVGLDVHKDSIAIALADGTAGDEVRHYGRVGGDFASLDCAVRQFGRGRSLLFTYEAGPCGFALYRRLMAQRQVCQVVAPSLIPRRPGDLPRLSVVRQLGEGQLTGSLLRNS